MKLLVAALAASVLLLTFVTVFLGARVREETVVAHPYEEGLTYDEERRALAAVGHDHGSRASSADPAACDLGDGPCTRSLGDGELSVELAPRPIAALRELEVSARLVRGGCPSSDAEVRLSFAMVGMDMGENAVRLAAKGKGRYEGKAVLVRCASGRRDWIVKAEVRQAGEDRRADFRLHLKE